MYKVLYHGKNKNARNHYFGINFKTPEEAEKFIVERNYTNLRVWRVVHGNGRPVEGYEWNEWRD